MAEAYDPAIAHQEIQRKGGKGEDQHLSRDLDGIGIAKDWHGSRRQHRQQQKEFLGCRKAARLHDALRQSAMTRSAFRPAEQAPRLHHKHQRHQQEHQHQRDVRENQHAESLQLADQQRGEESTSDGAHAANDRHHKGFGDDGKIHLRGSGNTGDLQGATQPRQKSAQKQRAGKKQSLIDTKRAHHIAVARGGAQQDAKACLMHQQPQQPQHHRSCGDQEKLISRKALIQNHHTMAQPWRAWPGNIQRPPKIQHRILHHQHHAESRQQLKHLRHLIDAPKQHDFHQHAKHTHHTGGNQHAGKE